jgi:hypothetical protein
MKVWVHDSGGGKLEGRLNEGRWVGFDEDSTHAHRIYWPGKQTVSVERDIKFDENFTLIPAYVDESIEGEGGDKGAPNHSEHQEAEHKEVQSDFNLPVDKMKKSVPLETNDSRKSSRIKKPAAYIRNITSGEGLAQGTYRTGKVFGTKIPAGMGTNLKATVEEDEIQAAGVEFVMGAATTEAEGLEPRTLEEAMKHADWPMSEEAISKEIEAL